jgi:hypothetical protein
VLAPVERERASSIGTGAGSHKRTRYGNRPNLPIDPSMTGRNLDPHAAGRVPDEPLIGIRELAAWLGVSEHAVRKWVTRGPEARAADGTRLTPLILRINGQARS